MNAKENKSVSNGIENATSPSIIKPGEASLALSFSCLHSSIDGVEALMRVGVAAAAYAVSAIVAHRGKPCYGIILESRKFCVSDGLALLFCFAGVSETFPQANALLELRPLPSK
jgi:hypothetical protein